ncbi:MAG: DUF2723 domain-containing protein [Anaerolineae bacterium]|nr:DUF2723 domain-containing protein [Anaerolineae bacterium]
MSGDRPGRWRGLVDPFLAVLLGGAAFALYALTLAPTVLAGDPGEFQLAPYLLGVAHPTGYPLYTLLGWAWSHLLPVGDVAYRMNLFSAFWAALAVGLLYPTGHSLVRQALPGFAPAVRRILAVLATATFAVTPTFWSQAIIAEVYALHLFLVVALLYFLLAWAERRNSVYLLPAAACFGLGLAHHRTTLVLAPALLAYLWLVGRSDPEARPNRRQCLLLLLLIVLPLAFYLYIPFRAPHTPYLHLPLAPDRELSLYDNKLSTFFSFVLGGPFGGSLDLTVDLGARLAMAWELLGGEIGWPGILLALAGVGWLAATRRWALLALTGLIWLGTVAFNLVYTIGDIYVLFIPSYLVFVLWLAVGAGVIAQALTKVAPHKLAAAPLGALALVAALFALPAWMGLSRYDDLDSSRRAEVRAGWEAILSEPLPAGAVLVSDDRNDIMPMWYLQYVEHKRPDLLGLFPLIRPDYPTLGHALDLALGAGRPVYLIKEMQGIEVKVRTQPEGRLWRLAGPAVTGQPVHARDIRLGDAVKLAGYDLSARSPRPGEELQVSLYWEPLRPLEAEYHSFVHLVDATGQPVVQSDRQPGGVFYPSTLWQPGERLRDDHSLTMPAGTPPGVYRLLVGLYALLPDGSLQPLGEPVVAGQLAVKERIQTEPGAIGQPATANFDGQIELLGYDVARLPGSLAVTLHWRALQPPAQDYSVFVHLLDAEGRIVAQHDGQPQNGAYPTCVWDKSEVVADEHLLDLPPDLQVSGCRLRVGWYLPGSGDRLPVAGGGDSVELHVVE